MNKTLLKTKEDFDNFMAEQKTFDNRYYGDEPTSYPCVMVWQEQDNPRGGYYRYAEIVCLADFEE